MCWTLWSALPAEDGAKTTKQKREKTDVFDHSKNAATRRKSNQPRVRMRSCSIGGERHFDERNEPVIIEELSFTTVRQRLIAVLLRLARTDGKRSKEGVVIEMPKSHQDLAAELGTVRELISRNLGRLEAEGYLDVEGRKIVVKNLAGLEQEQTATT